jgi:endonuclease V
MASKRSLPPTPHFPLHLRHRGLIVGLGLASHLGVLLDIPTVGVAKNLLYMSDIASSTTYDTIRAHLTPQTPSYKVVGESGTVYGAAVIPRRARDLERPIYVSVGHLVDLDMAVELVHETARFRIPEAIRAADGGSREVLRVVQEESHKKGMS